MIRHNEFNTFRLKGISFAIHNEPDSHKFVNPTMLSRMEGKKKGNRDPCSVLGFWGDLCIGPFSVWGVGGI